MRGCLPAIVAKKRDASTDLLRPLHGYMQQHNVVFIGGDFNMERRRRFKNRVLKLHLLIKEG